MPQWFTPIGARISSKSLGLLKVWLALESMPPERMPHSEPARIQPDSIFPFSAVDASGDRFDHTSARPLAVASILFPDGLSRGRASEIRRRTIPSPRYHWQHRPCPLTWRDVGLRVCWNFRERNCDPRSEWTTPGSHKWPTTTSRSIIDVLHRRPGLQSRIDLTQLRSCC